MPAEIRDPETERRLRVRCLAQLTDRGHGGPATGPGESAGTNHDEDVLSDDVALGEVQRSAHSTLTFTVDAHVDGRKRLGDRGDELGFTRRAAVTGEADARAGVGVKDAALAAVRDATGVAAVVVGVAAAAPGKRALADTGIVVQHAAVDALGRQRVATAGTEPRVFWIVLDVAEAETVEVRVDCHPPVLDAARVFAACNFNATFVLPLVGPAVLDDPIRLRNSTLVLGVGLAPADDNNGVVDSAATLGAPVHTLGVTAAGEG